MKSEVESMTIKELGNAVDIPEMYDLTASQAIEIREDCTDLVDLICVAFRYGFLQGRKAEQEGRK